MAHKSCACGCGAPVLQKFLRGHNARLRARALGDRKVCPTCGAAKPYTADYFPRCRGRRGGLSSECKPCHVARGIRWARNHPEKIRVKSRLWHRRYRQLYPERYVAVRQRSAAKLRSELIAAYGGECACCGEQEPGFLTLEHIGRTGKRHRDEVGQGEAVWRDLKKRGWPKDGFTLLCWNCNMATSRGRTCPHKDRPALTLDAS